LARLAIQEQLRIQAGIEGTALFTGYRQTIDNRGVVIFILPHGGTIRDAGKKLHFSPDEVTREAATRPAACGCTAGSRVSARILLIYLIFSFPKEIIPTSNNVPSCEEHGDNQYYRPYETWYFYTCKYH
jgi:hypothetical protein